jgi:hypothetical protein
VCAQDDHVGSEGIDAVPDTTPLTPQERVLRAKIAAAALHKSRDSGPLIEAARANSPADLRYWEAKVDREGTLPNAERRKRAAHAQSEYFLRLSVRVSARPDEETRPDALKRRQPHADGASTPNA